MSYQGYGGFYVPRLTLINKGILISCGILFFIQSVLKITSSFALESLLGLSGQMFFQGYFHQVLTYPFVQTDFFSFLFNGLLIWFIGSELEFLWGTKSYIRFLLGTVLSAAVMYLVVASLFFSSGQIFDLPMIGLHGICLGLLMAYGYHFQDRILTFMMIFPLRAKHFCALIVGIEFYMALFSPYRKSAWGHIGALIFAFLFLWGRKWWNLRRGQKLRSAGVDRRKKSHLQIVRTEDEEEKKTHSSGNGPKFWQ